MIAAASLVPPTALGRLLQSFQFWTRMNSCCAGMPIRFQCVVVAWPKLGSVLPVGLSWCPFPQ
eukprot:779965-Pleurochrysis_carterae.AAC.1